MGRKELIVALCSGVAPISIANHMRILSHDWAAGCFSKIVSTPLPMKTRNPETPRPCFGSKLYWARESLTKPPIWRHNIVEFLGHSIRGGDLEGQRLAIEIGIRLPVSTPVPRHGHPTGPGAFDWYWLNRSSPSYIADQYQFEVVPSIDCKSDTPMLLTRNPETLLNNVKNCIDSKSYNLWSFRKIGVHQHVSSQRDFRFNGV